jgi:DNA-binding transcriptional MerR regulator
LKYAQISILDSKKTAWTSVPKPKTSINAFPPATASAIVGMSVHMLNYLARQGYLIPAYEQSGRRGKTRYYSYRDLVIARLVQKLLDGGIELSRLKEGIKKLATHKTWSSTNPDKTFRMLATDGKNLLFVEEEGTVVDLTKNGQLTFAFVLDVAAARDEVKRKLNQEQLANFNLRNLRIKYSKVG